MHFLTLQNRVLRLKFTTVPTQKQFYLWSILICCGRSSLPVKFTLESIFWDHPILRDIHKVSCSWKQQMVIAEFELTSGQQYPSHIPGTLQDFWQRVSLDFSSRSSEHPDNNSEKLKGPISIFGKFIGAKTEYTKWNTVKFYTRTT